MGDAGSTGKAVVRMRPEAERRLRESFQRRVDEQGNRYAAQLAQARQQAARFECGEVAGVFSAQAGGNVLPRTYVVALLPLVAIPVLIAAAATGFPGTLPLLGASPFLAGAWIGVSFWRGREPKRQVWLYAFTGGFMLLDGPPQDARPVPWHQVTEVGQVWADTYHPGDDDSTPVLAAYRLRSADGRTHEISRSFRNVQDPYGEIGQLFRGLAPGTVGKTMPRFPTIDEIIATYARQPGWNA
jgi:hypothetical protein